MQLYALIFACVLAHAHSKLLQLSCKNIKEFVNGHNERRLRIARGEVAGQPGAAKMALVVWDSELANKAAGWASKLRHDHNPNKNVGSGRFRTGENLYWFSTKNDKDVLRVEQPLDSWFNEYKNYTFGPFKARLAGDPKIGHYTQMVWADTTYLGCAMSWFKDGDMNRYFVVCNYGPTGNFRTKLPYSPSRQGSRNLVCTVGNNRCTKQLYGDKCPRN